MVKVDIRKANLKDVKGIAVVHTDCWKTTYSGLMPDSLLANLSYEQSETRFKTKIEDMPSNQFIFVAVDEFGRVVGFVHGGAERSGGFEDFGEIYAIYILNDYQRIGVGKKLVRASVTSLKKSGFNKMIIWVLKNNKYEKFYKDLGGNSTEVKIEELKDTKLDLAGYTWDKL